MRTSYSTKATEDDRALIVMGGRMSSIPAEPEPIQAARRAVQRSDQMQGSAAESPAMRDALRALIDFASNLNVRLQAVEARSHVDTMRPLG